MQNKQLSYLFRFFVISLILVLSACSTISRDGPPSCDVDETKIPNATPKKEPLSKLGNLPSYRVFGHKYFVMKSSKNYEEIGTASWYGSKFHRQRTSSGERYDMLGMTAAHKTLPLPTYVLVTNMKNKKQVIVKVNDRGPFESNRLIDLSYVAAKKLGMLGRGTALVDVKAIDPATFDENTYESSRNIAIVKNTQHQRGVYIQVGAFKNKLYAERMRGRLHKMLASPVNIASKRHMFEVKIGPLKDYTTASRLTQRLNALGIHSKEITEV